MFYICVVTYVSYGVQNRLKTLENLPICICIVGLCLKVLSCVVVKSPMKEQIKQFIESKLDEDGVVETGIEGVQIFRVTTSVRCAPAIYEPTVVAIVSGVKEAILDGEAYIYDSRQYMCCTLSLPVEAGTPKASVENPLLGVTISLNPKIMSDMVVSMESSAIGLQRAARKPQSGPLPKGLGLAPWDEAFGSALFRLLQLADSPLDIAMLGEGRLREFYYALLKGEAWESARRAFGVGNDVARIIEYMSSNLSEPISIDEISQKLGMSRAVLHRKFKQATTLSPIQFVKSMRLNKAAMNIAGGTSVNEAALDVGYTSSSQFSREFKRLYGQSPKQWSQSSDLSSLA